MIVIIMILTATRSLICMTIESVQTTTIRPLKLVSHVVQKHLAGVQEIHLDKTNEELKW